MINALSETEELMFNCNAQLCDIPLGMLMWVLFIPAITKGLNIISVIFCCSLCCLIPVPSALLSYMWNEAKEPYGRRWATHCHSGAHTSQLQRKGGHEVQITQQITTKPGGRRSQSFSEIAFASTNLFFACNRQNTYFHAISTQSVSLVATLGKSVTFKSL